MVAKKPTRKGSFPVKPRKAQTRFKSKVPVVRAQGTKRSNTR